jgi:hypothetical protein
VNDNRDRDSVDLRIRHRVFIRKVERKGFEALLTAADAGKIDAIIYEAPRSSDPASGDVRPTP